MRSFTYISSNLPIQNGFVQKRTITNENSFSDSDISTLLSTNNLNLNNQEGNSSNLTTKLNLETLKLFTEADLDEDLPDDGAHNEEEGSVMSNATPKTKCCKFNRYTRAQVDRMFPLGNPL